MVQLGEEAHLNTSFKHFIFFVQEFNLIEKRELAPLQELIDKLTGRGGPGSSTVGISNTNLTASNLTPTIPEERPLGLNAGQQQQRSNSGHNQNFNQNNTAALSANYHAFLSNNYH